MTKTHYINQKKSVRRGRRFLIYCMCLMVGLVSLSCEKNAFNFSHLSGSDIESEWGIPLINAKYSIEDIVSRLENNSVLSAGENDILTMTYTAEFDEIIKASDYLTFGPIHESGNVEIPVPARGYRNDLVFAYSVPVDLSNPYVLLKEGSFDEGVFNLTLAHNIPSGSGMIRITSPNISRENGSEFVAAATLAAGTVTVHLDFSHCTIRPDDQNQIALDVEIHIPEAGAPALESVIVDYNLDAAAITLREADLVQISPISIPYSKTFNVHINNGNFGGDFLVYDPLIKIFVKNSFDLAVNCQLDKTEFSGVGLPTVAMIPEPVTVTIPNSPNQFTEAEVSTIPSIHFYADYSLLSLNGNIMILPSEVPNDVIHIDQHSSVSLKVSTEVPLRMDLNEVSFRDTIRMDNINLFSVNNIQNMVLRILFENDLPLDLFTQIYFSDDSYAIMDSAFSSPHLLQGAYTDAPVLCQPIFVERTNFDEIQRLLHSPYIIIAAKLNTEGKVDVDVNQYFKTKVSAKFDVVL